MSNTPTESGMAKIGNAELYYEIAGEGQPLVMIHAGVADHRQWDNEFPHFAENFRVLRYDMRSYGKSEPVQGEFSNMGDLVALLDHVGFREPLVMMGCSMGGGLELDVPTPPKFAEAEAAYKAGDLDRVAELEAQIWFDGMTRTPGQVNQGMRQLLYEMNRHALALDAKGLGKRLPDSEVPAADRLREVKVPVLVIVGAHDTPYIHAAADYMVEKIASARKVVIDAAAHLPNMDQPEEFKQVLDEFLEEALK